MGGGLLALPLMRLAVWWCRLYVIDEYPRKVGAWDKIVGVVAGKLMILEEPMGGGLLALTFLWLAVWGCRLAVMKEEPHAVGGVKLRLMALVELMGCGLLSLTSCQLAVWWWGLEIIEEEARVAGKWEGIVGRVVCFLPFVKKLMPGLECLTKSLKKKKEKNM